MLNLLITLLKPESTRQQIDQIIDEAKEYNFKSICVNPTHDFVI